MGEQKSGLIAARTLLTPPWPHTFALWKPQEQGSMQQEAVIMHASEQPPGLEAPQILSRSIHIINNIH